MKDWTLTGKNHPSDILNIGPSSDKFASIPAGMGPFLHFVRVVRRFAAESMNVLLIFGSTNVSEFLK